MRNKLVYAQIVQNLLGYYDGILDGCIMYSQSSIIQTFSLVPILSWIFISHDQDPQP